MCLTQLQKSRRRLQPGDIFAMAPSDGKYLYGRIIATNANPLGVGGGVLVYIYKARSTDKRKVPDLMCGQLLVAPIITNRLGWSRGYFEFVENRALTAMDCLRQHCFVRAWSTPVQYFDETGKSLPGPTEPVGQWGLYGHEAIDEEVCAALGLR